MIYSTLRPWTSPLNNSRTHHVPKPAVTVRRPNITNDIFDAPSTYVKFYSIVSPSNADLSKLNMFAVDREIGEIIGEPARISPSQDKSLTVKVKNDAQGQKLLTMKTLVKETVTVQPHGRFNVSQGVITSSSLKEYSEEQLVEGLTDQGVSKAYRIKRKADQGNLILTNSLILTFNSSIPPEKVHIWARYFERVCQYIPLPRRCFRCQGYGHTTQNCRSSKAYCGVCSEECTTDHTTTTCNRPFYCLHCQEPHATSSKKCTRYLMEKELLAVKTKEQLTFAEARRRINELFPNMKTTYAAAVRTPPVPCPQPATLQTSQPATFQPFRHEYKN